jgi:hypothetical protein
MSQKSSVIQIANLVPWVLTPDNEGELYLPQFNEPD